jgi:hypothetical protein
MITIKLFKILVFKLIKDNLLLLLALQEQGNQLLPD